jgi:hypothetical protein
VPRVFRSAHILESTAKDSTVGFPLRYNLDQIDSIIEPFSNEKVDIKSLKFTKEI